MTTDETNIVSEQEKLLTGEALSEHDERSVSPLPTSQRAKGWIPAHTSEAVLPEEEEKESLKEKGSGSNQEERNEGPSSSKNNTGNGMSLRSILGGDILTNDFFRRQMKLLVLLVILAIIYISNRYSCQQEMIEIDQLKKELTDIKYDALTRSSELTEKSRQSHIEEYVSQEGSALQTSTNPPYLIK